MTPINLTREELYEAVWSKPVLKLAKEWGISDVGLAKICKRFNIPRPNRGYWAKVQNGQSLKRTPLPYVKNAGAIVISTYPHNPRETEPDPEQVAAVNKFKEIGKYPASRILVREDLQDLHPLVSGTLKLLNKAEADRSGRLTIQGTESLALLVSPPLINRSIRIMDALVRALESRGLQVRILAREFRQNTYNYQQPKQEPQEFYSVVEALNEQVEFLIFEETLYQQVQPDAGSKQGSFRQSLAVTDYQYVPSGKLTLRIAESSDDGHHRGLRRTWTDTDKQDVESLLNSFIDGIVKIAVNRRSVKLERERERKRREREQRRSAWRQQIETREKKRVQQLMDDLSRMRLAEEIRSYVALVGVQSMEVNVSGKQDAGLIRWIVWATRIADQMDPRLGDPPDLITYGKEVELESQQFGFPHYNQQAVRQVEADILRARVPYWFFTKK